MLLRSTKWIAYQQFVRLISVRNINNPAGFPVQTRATKMYIWHWYMGLWFHCRTTRPGQCRGGLHRLQDIQWKKQYQFWNWIHSRTLYTRQSPTLKYRASPRHTCVFVWCWWLALVHTGTKLDENTTSLKLTREIVSAQHIDPASCNSLRATKQLCSFIAL